MNKLIFTLLVIAFTGCATQTGAPFAVTAHKDVTTALPYLRPGAAVACSAVLALAVNSKDRADIAGDIYSIGSVIYSLSGGAIVSPEQLQKAVAGVVPKSAEYSVLATTIEGIYAGLYPQIQGDPKLVLQVLQALAGGCNDAATAFLAKAASPTPNPTP